MLLLVERVSRQLRRVLKDRKRKEQLGSVNRKKTASGVIPMESAKQSSRSRGEVFTNISQLSCREIFGAKHLWQSLGI